MPVIPNLECVTREKFAHHLSQVPSSVSRGCCFITRREDLTVLFQTATQINRNVIGGICYSRDLAAFAVLSYKFSFKLDTRFSLEIMDNNRPVVFQMSDSIQGN